MKNLKVRHKIVCVDVDGVIFDTMQKKYSLEKYHPLIYNGSLMKGCNEVLQKFLDVGWEVVLSSGRFDTDWVGNSMYTKEQILVVLKFVLEENKVPYSRISLVKPVADAYIDDRGVVFKNWSDIETWFEIEGVFK